MPRGRNFFGRGFWWRGAYSPYPYGGMQSPVWGGGRGNPYPFCRFYPWLPRRWWAYGAYPPPAQLAYPYNMPAPVSYAPQGTYTPMW